MVTKSTQPQAQQAQETLEWAVDAAMELLREAAAPPKPVIHARPPNRMVSFNIPYPLYEAVNELRVRTGVTMTQLIVEVLTPEVERRLAQIGKGG